MRPRLHGRGERVAAGVRLEPVGPASMRPRLHGRGEREGYSKSSAISLQCGHGYMAVENPAAGSQRQRRRLASMRPRLHGRGERAIARFAFVPRSGLQCGHGYMAVENEEVTWTDPTSPPRFNAATATWPWRTWSVRPARPAPRCFNAATATWPWRTSASRSPPSTPNTLQCGHGYMAVENVSQRWQPGQ